MPIFHSWQVYCLFFPTVVSCGNVALSPRIAEAVVARRWQRAQRVRSSKDGGATITFDAYDLGEIVRWAFGFGAEARIVDPPEAVRLAQDMVGRLGTTYASIDRRSESA